MSTKGEIKFNYIDYGQKIVDSLSKGKNNLYIFSSYLLRNLYKEKTKVSIFEKIPTVLTLDEFKKEIYKSDKIILREAKRTLSLYLALSSRTKKKIGIEGYYEFITLANEFFVFYASEFKCLIKEYKNIEKWQVEKIENYSLMKKEYDVYLKKNNFIPFEWVENYENLDLSYIKKFEKIIFVDIIDFTLLDKEIIKEMKKYVDIEFSLQIKEGDFDEVNLSIKDISLSKVKRDIKVYKLTEETEEGTNLIESFKGKIGNDIFTPNIDNVKLNLLLPKYFTSTKLPVLNDTEIYKFMKVHHEILGSFVPELKNAISFSALEQGMSLKSFKLNYNITSEDIENFYILIEDSYKYFLPELTLDENFQKTCTEELSNKLVKIYEDIATISTFTTVEEYFNFYKNEPNLIYLFEINYTNIVEKYFEAFSLARTSEFLDDKKGLKNIFSENKSLGILNLIIKYMNNMELNELKINFENDKKNDRISVIKDLSLAVDRQERESYFIGITSKNLPGNENNETIFTEYQKLENGLKTKEKIRIEKKYRFFQGVLTSKNSIIYYIENSKDNETISPFLEELIEKCDLKIESGIIDLDESLLRIKESLKSPKVSLEKHSLDNLEKSLDDIEEKKINLGTYDYTDLHQCEYKYYLGKMKKINGVKAEQERNFSPKFLGILVHEFLERIGRMKKNEIENEKSFTLNREKVEKELRYLLKKYRYKIPIHLDSYFKEVLFELFIKNTEEFYEYLGIILRDAQVNKFSSEASKYSTIPFLDDKIKVYLRGRVDLAVETNIGKYIIDYKTGIKNEFQLDFYSILLYGNEEAAEKMIFNPMSGTREKAKKIVLTREIIKEKLINFINTPYYSKAEKKGYCKNCSYMEICRKELD
ncbi:MAG: PD-(D/E)XK nuclease family protein [Fusobacteriaceae bacterium]